DGWVGHRALLLLMRRELRLFGRLARRGLCRGLVVVRRVVGALVGKHLAVVTRYVARLVARYDPTDGLAMRADHGAGRDLDLDRLVVNRKNVAEDAARQRHPL